MALPDNAGATLLPLARHAIAQRLRRQAAARGAIGIRSRAAMLAGRG